MARWRFQFWLSLPLWICDLPRSLRKHLISNACILSMSAVKVHVLQKYGHGQVENVPIKLKYRINVHVSNPDYAN